MSEANKAGWLEAQSRGSSLWLEGDRDGGPMRAGVDTPGEQEFPLVLI